MSNPIVLKTDLDLPLVHRGKVRDIYSADGNLLIVTTDRLSAFDVVFDQGIPDKGRVLTAISCLMAAELPSCKPYHLLATDPAEMGPRVARYTRELDGRVMLVEPLDMVPIECVVRGYLVGSSFKDYRATGTVCGIPLPAGMKLGDAFTEPLFTPSTKAALGTHDENISFEQAAKLIGGDAAAEIKERSLAVFREGADYAKRRGLILVDTKFELGRRKDATLVLADEVLTPDSSRYWDAAEAASAPAGETPPSFDKQVVRDYLETLAWNKQPPAPALPAQIVERAAARYRELLDRLRSGMRSR